QSSSHKIVCASDRVSDLTNSIALLFEYIYQRYRINFDIEIDVAKDYTEILSKIATGIKKNSIASTDLINSWDYNKNCGISPESISLGSDRKVWWKCEKGHSWQATVSSRSGKEKCGCPYCAGQRVIPGENDLETLYPKIAKEWDYNKNIKKPSEVMSMDNRKYWWICPQCGNSYQSSPSHRAGRGGGCPACARARTIASHFKKVVNIDTNEVYDSINEASIATGANARSISNCCRGKRKTAGGYHWKFFKNQ
ncbi:MAG: hypothetical protein J6Q55_04355, partial [Clostridia bacterium]|nr:hypothetical protein [Clostridia bacterium]